MATFVLFNKFLEALAEKKHNLGSDTLRIALTNTAPTAATDTVYDPVTLHPPPAAANGYTTGGYTVTVDSSSESGGTYTLACTTDIDVDADEGGIGPFRYALMYNDTASNDEVIGYWDRGSSVTIASSDPPLVLDISGSLITITAA